MQDFEKFCRMASMHKVAPIKVGEETFHVRTITSAERDRLAEFFKRESPVGKRAVSAALYLSDANGKSLVSDPFDPKVIEIFNGMRAEILEAILVAGMELNKIGVSESAAGDDRKNSSTTPGA